MENKLDVTEVPYGIVAIDGRVGAYRLTAKIIVSSGIIEFIEVDHVDGADLPYTDVVSYLEDEGPLQNNRTPLRLGFSDVAGHVAADLEGHATISPADQCSILDMVRTALDDCQAVIAAKKGLS